MLRSKLLEMKLIATSGHQFGLAFCGTWCPFDAANHLCNNFILLFFPSSLDVTAVCILEGFQNQQSMLLADKVLKLLGKEKAKEKYKVNLSWLIEGIYIVKSHFNLHCLNLGMMAVVTTEIRSVLRFFSCNIGLCGLSF